MRLWCVAARPRLELSPARTEPNGVRRPPSAPGVSLPSARPRRGLFSELAAYRKGAVLAAMLGVALGAGAPTRMELSPPTSVCGQSSVAQSRIGARIEAAL